MALLDDGGRLRDTSAVDSDAKKTRRRPPNRTTVNVPTQIAPALVWQAQADARASGFKTLRAYLEVLITQGLSAESDDDVGGRRGQFLSAAPALLPTLLGHRTVRALEALTDRIDGGEDVGTLETELRSLRTEIVGALLELRGDYEREIDARDERLLSGQL